MNIQPTEIVGIPFPYTDMATEKRRPVLVLTNPDQRGDFTGLAITSVPTQEKSVCIGAENMESGKLPKISWVRYDKIFTLNSSLIEKKYGAVNKGAFDYIIDHLCDYLGCRYV